VPIFKAFIILALTGVIFSQTYIIQSRDDSIFVSEAEYIESALDSILLQEPAWGKYLLLKNIKSEKSVKLNYVHGFEELTIDSIHIQNGQNVNQSISQLIFKPLLHTHPDQETRKSLLWLNKNYSWLESSPELDYGIYGRNRLAAVINYYPAFASYIKGVAAVSQAENGNWEGKGELDLNIENIGGKAGITKFQWQRPDNHSQRTYFSYEEPFSLGLPLGLSLEIEQELIKKLYLKKARTGMVSSVSRFGLWSLGGKSEIFTSTGPDSTERTEPKLRSVSIRFRGDTRNHRWLPSTGNFWDLRIEIGQDVRQEKSSFYELFLSSGIFINVRRSTIYLGLRAEGIWMKSKLHPGKIIHYGGSSSFRGYEERKFATDRVLIPTGEWLILESVQQQIFLFLEAAIQNQVKPLPFSYGFGYRQDTSRVAFSIVYGLGRYDDLSSGKLHLKVITKL